MDDKISLINTLRGFGSLYIIIHHFTLYHYHPLLFFVLGQGQLIVILFLIVSGFLAEYSVTRKKNSSQWYFILKKVIRIYPIYLASIFLTYLVASLYFREFLDIDIKNILGHIVNLQQLNRTEGYLFNVYLNNTPLWYVAYVWWFYVTFFILKILSVKQDFLIVFFLSLLGSFTFFYYPNPISHITSYLIIPWLGVEAGKLYVQNIKITVSSLLKPILGCGFLAGLFLISALLNYDITIYGVSRTPLIEFRHFISAPVLIMLFFIWRKFNYWGVKKLQVFSRFSSISYALFLIHYPLLISYPLFFKSNILLNTILTIPIVLGLAYFLEKVMQPYIFNLINKHN